jgi:hypothetical protein
MSNILITLNNFNRFSKRLQKILTHKFEQPIGYSETQEMLSQTLGVENLHEMQQALKKQSQEVVSQAPVSFAQNIEQMKDTFIESFYRDCSQLRERFPETMGLVEVMSENNNQHSKHYFQSFVLRFTLQQNGMQKYMHFAGGGQTRTSTDLKRFNTNLQVTNDKLGGLPDAVNEAMTHIFNTYVGFDNGKFLETCLHHYMVKKEMNLKAKKLIMHTYADGLMPYTSHGVKNSEDKSVMRISVKSITLTPTETKVIPKEADPDFFKHLDGAFKSNKPM